MLIHSNVDVVVEDCGGGAVEEDASLDVGVVVAVEIVVAVMVLDTQPILRVFIFRLCMPRLISRAVEVVAGIQTMPLTQ